MKILIRPRGYITSRFANTEGYRASSHTGIDFKNKFKGGVRTVAGGNVYKIRRGDSMDLQEYRIVYQLCDTPLGLFEVAYVHLWDIIVSETGFRPAGSLLGTEGNTGELVFRNGIKVEKHEKPSGKGSHLHLSVRPVELVREKVDGEHYLRTLGGASYKDADGNYYHIRYRDNGAKGWVDFEQWLYTPTRSQAIGIILKMLGWIRNELAKVVK